ncbi:hypothetical protein SPHINGOT1_480014 [Sphingomonas sp. T1]|nr:hypothetical protein SPHINGOT1_480014 [Sphingomonas sp. T1]
MFRSCHDPHQWISQTMANEVANPTVMFIGSPIFTKSEKR